MTMDAEALDVLMNTIRSAWQRPLSEYEDDQWRRMLRTDPATSLDENIVGETIEFLRGHPRFEHTRPDVVTFRGHYDRILESTKPKPVDPSDMPSTTEQAMAHLDAARALLMADSSVSSEESRDAAEQLL